MRILVGRRPRTTLVRLGCLVVGTAVLFGLVYIPIRVSGNSMAPTYRSGWPNLVNRLSYHRHEPRRSDVVAIRLAGLKVLLLKRIVGLPGEEVSVRKGTVFINGQPLDEPYLPGKVSWAEGRHRLKENEYFVVGDNRAISEYYIISRPQIVGRIVF